MKLIDIHAHLEHPKFSEDLENVIKKSGEKGIKKIITSGTTPKTNRESLELSKKFKIVDSSFGIYPVDALAFEADVDKSEIDINRVDQFDVNKELEWIEENKDKCVAIGECGLDYKYIEDEELKNKQKDIFKKVIKKANKLDKPLIIHSRKADSDALEILKNASTQVVLHCFNGNKKLINEAIRRGYFFSVPPVIKRLKHFQMLVDMVPLNQLLTETDAPFLSSKRGKRNDPLEVEITIEEIAKILNEEKEDVASQIYKNYERVLDIN